MTTLDRAERAATVVAAFAGVAFPALAVGTPIASAAGAEVTDAGTATVPAMMGGGMMGGTGGFPFVFFPFMFLAFAALLALGYVGIRALAEGGERDRVDEEADGDAETDPIARLQRRYTEGELTEAEFERALERELGGEETDGGVDRGEATNGGLDRTDEEGDVGGASAERSLSGRER